MRDLTEGSIPKHLLGMAGFIGFGLIAQTLYVLVDLYFVAHLGGHAVAGVAAAASSMFITMSLGQLIAVGALSLISQAVGRKDVADGQLVFEQSLTMAIVAALLTLLIGYSFGSAGIRLLAADEPTALNGQAYFFAYLPSLALMFVMGAMSTALRATGVVGAPMIIQSFMVGLNVIFAPILIAGWFTGAPLGVVGAGLASSLATAIGVAILALRFNRIQAYLKLHLPSLRPRLDIWRRIVAIGLPATGEFMLLFIVSAVVYWAIRGFGAEAQAGFGIGSRIMQSIFLPAMAVAFAASPIAGQNFGAKRADRVRATFRHAALIGSAIMLCLTALCQLRPDLLVYPFTQEEAVVTVAVDYLRIASFNFVAVGLVFACSGMFQALGNTIPSLISSGSRLITFVLPAILLSYRPETVLYDFWYVSVASLVLQAVTSLLLLRVELRRKLGPLTLI